MRRSLVWVFVAVSSIVALAFVIPLGFVVRTTAVDRAIDTAREDSAAVVQTLVANPSPVEITAAMAATAAGSEGRMTVVLPDGRVMGPAVRDRTLLDAALESGASNIGNVPGGREVVTAVVDERGMPAAIRVFVPSAELHKGQTTAWVALAVVAVTLVGLSVVVADRLAQTIVRPTQELVTMAKELGEGELHVRVPPDGPPELVELSSAFNELAARISSMLEDERELVAELSHRLRTPLTALRMRLDQIDDPQLRADLTEDVDRVTAVVTALISEARRRPTDRRSAACNAGATVAGRVEYWAIIAKAQGRPWRFERASGQSWVALGEDELLAAVDVLIDNVFAHTPEGVGLEVRVEQEAGYVRITVHDDGPGFDPELVAPGVGLGEGTGLGLAIAERTAQRVGGRLEIDRSQSGATVVLALPAMAAPPNRQSDIGDPLI